VGDIIVYDRHGGQEVMGWGLIYLFNVVEDKTLGSGFKRG